MPITKNIHAKPGDLENAPDNFPCCATEALEEIKQFIPKSKSEISLLNFVPVEAEGNCTKSELDPRKGLCIFTYYSFFNKDVNDKIKHVIE